MKTTRLLVILGFGLAIGAFFYLKIRRDEAAVQWRSDCINNLNWIAGAKDMLAHDQGLAPGTTVNTETVANYVVDGWPKCPAGGEYTLNPIGTNPTCTIRGHSLTP